MTLSPQNRVEKRYWEKRLPYAFIAPHLILFIVFFVIPLGYGIYASFTKWNLFRDPVWVGLQNYKTILFDKGSTFYRQFWLGLKNTVLFVIICVPFQIIIPLLIALLLSRKPKGDHVYRSIFYLPTLFSITSVALTWLFIFNRSLGLWNNLFGTDVNWYGQQPFAWMAIVITTLWWCIGVNMVIYIAALGSIDQSVLDAAKIDGSHGFIHLFHIIFPSIRFSLTYTVVVSVIAQFNIYGQPLLLTAGGPKESTAVLLMFIRNLAFGTGESIAGLASAMSVCLGLIIGVVSLLQIQLMKTE